MNLTSAQLEELIASVVSWIGANSRDRYIHNRRFDALDDAWPGMRAMPAEPSGPAVAGPVGVQAGSDVSPEGSGGSARPGASSAPQCCGTCDAWEPDGTTMRDHDDRGDLLRGSTSCGVSIHTGHAWGSRCPAYRRRGTFPIKDSTRRQMPTTRDCSTCLLGEEPDTHPGCVGCHGVEGNPRWQPESKPDNCPLPADVSGWEWHARTGIDAGVVEARSGGWRLRVESFNGSRVRYIVICADGVVAQRECKTVDGGKRLSVKAARRAWRIRNGGGK